MKDNDLGIINDQTNFRQSDIDRVIIEEELKEQKKFSVMIELVKKELDQIKVQNRDMVRQEFSKLQNAYTKALTVEDPKEMVDTIVYTPEQMEKYGLDFLSHIDPMYVKDIQSNLDWYLENYNDILLNVSYPSKQEKEFLKHVETVQQRKNDQKYKKILKQIENAKRG